MNQPQPIIRKPWERQRVVVDLADQQKQTDDSQGNDTDINNIVARFARTGVMPEPQTPGEYADVTALQGDLTEIIEKGKQAQAELAEAKRKHEADQAAKIKENEETAEANAKRLAQLEAQLAKTTPPD